MASSDDLKRSFFDSLRPETLRAHFERFNPVLAGQPKERQVEFLLKLRPAMTMLLTQGNIELDELQQAAKRMALPVSLADDEIALARKLSQRVAECGRVELLGSHYVEFERTMQLAEEYRLSVHLLKRDHPGQPEVVPSAYWNPGTNAGEISWMVVDLNVHPTPTVRRKEVLLLGVAPGDREDRYFVERKPLPLRRPGDQWFPLYAVQTSELPTLDWLRAVVGERLAPESNVMSACEDHLFSLHPGKETHFFYDRATHPYDGLYAQLGGYPLAWPDEGAEEQQGLQLVLRTYAEAEPWLEVFLDEEDRFVVKGRIT